LSQITRLTDRRTDGQTDSILVANPRWHSMQHGKNRSIFEKTKRFLSYSEMDIDNVTIVAQSVYRLLEHA